MDLRGKFIVVDGPDGGGKGTQIERLKGLVERGGGAWTWAKDPGGTPIGDRIRHVLLDFDLSEMDARCEAMLFMASRAQLAAQVIRPALRDGRTVIGDRFISATCAYQVAAGFPQDEVIALGRLAVGETWPDLTLILDVPPEVGFTRTGGGAAGRGGKRAERGRSRSHAGQRDMFGDTHPDAMEARPLEFHRRVRQAFLELPGIYPRPVCIIDATADADTVAARVEEALRAAFE